MPPKQTSMPEDPNAFPTTAQGPDIGTLYAEGTLELPAPRYSTEGGLDEASRQALEQANVDADAHDIVAGAQNKQVMQARAAVDEALRDAPGTDQFKEQQ